MTQQIEKLNNIIDQIKILPLLDAHQLIKELEKIFEIDITLPFRGQAMDLSSTSLSLEQKNSQLEQVQEKTTFDVILNEVPGDKKIGILKIIRTITGFGLKESKDIVDNIPKTIKENITKEECEKIKSELESAGAKVLIK